MKIATATGRVQTNAFRGFRERTAAGFKRDALELRLCRDEGPAQQTRVFAESFVESFVDIPPSVYGVPWRALVRRLGRDRALA
jgi:hypothetical protein